MVLNPYESPQTEIKQRKRFQLPWLPETYSRLMLLVATMYWLMVLRDFVSGHQHTWDWFGAIVFILAWISTTRREKRQTRGRFQTDTLPTRE
jgi:hypothetical protein